MISLHKHVTRVFPPDWSNTHLFLLYCHNLSSQARFYIVKGCGDYIFPGRGRKDQLGKIPIEINSNMTADLDRHSPKMKIGCQILNNAPICTMIASKSSHWQDISYDRTIPVLETDTLQLANAS